ncbi:MAG TPA: FAD-dependent oxidoreductase [Sphaerochaeta sp.]|nr:FAD-dependent oxidoreductase [Sphaerochaeta sp.]
MKYDVVVVGGGIAGLTAASYCVRQNLSVLLCEKHTSLGGNANSFERGGFVFDQGIRSIENSGIVFPMLDQLGIKIDFIKSSVTLGVADQMIKVDKPESLDEYALLLGRQFPDNVEDIALIKEEIRKIMGYMHILYGIDNPLFLDSFRDLKYLTRTLLPWMIKYKLSMPKVSKLKEPVHEYLKKFTTNQALIDIIAQHFFKDTPTFFALSYFSLYLDYNYPKGGTRAIPKAMESFFTGKGGTVVLNSTIEHVDVTNNTVTDQKGNTYSYKQLIWAADMKSLYREISYDKISDTSMQKDLLQKRDTLEQFQGGDSIFSLYLAIDLPVSYFREIASAHLFYTPVKTGLSQIDGSALAKVLAKSPDETTEADKATIKEWLTLYYAYTTYEVSCPAMRDATLAPEGKTALLVSTLLDYSLTKHIKEALWYEEFKLFSEEAMIEVLSASLYPKMKDKILQQFSSSPLTLERITGNSEGAITGWAFTKRPLPVEHEMDTMIKSVETSIPNVSQAGQWVFSPSGLPISVLTGKLASDRAIKALKKKR